MTKKYIDLSVHQLVDFLLRRGDIDDRIYNQSSMNEGTRLHSVYQKVQDDSYMSEYPLSGYIYSDDVTIFLHGRADGIFKRNNYYVIDEIKSTTLELEEFHNAQKEWHIGQAMCYAYLFMKEQNLSSIGIKLTYLKQGSKEKLEKEYSFLQIEVYQYVENLIDEYIEFYNIIFRHIEERGESIKTLQFPFESYREGQSKLAKLVYASIIKKNKLFVEAPTGIGKTISTIFPSIKSLNECSERIFYLTAKTSGRLAADNCIKLLKTKGLNLNHIIITAKDKICFCKGKECNPDECPFAKKYFEKIQNALRYSLLNYSSFDYQTIIEIAKYFEICPFEYQLDLSLFCDLIICDFNYVFDPISHLKRYFDEDYSKHVILVDEAHNLVDRSRDMYSSLVDENSFLKAKSSLRKISSPKLKNKINKILRIIDNIKENLTDEYTIVSSFDSELLNQLELFLDKYLEVKKELKISLPNEVVDLYLEINRFCKIYQITNEKYVFYIHKEKYISFHLFCTDASNFINRICTNSLSSIFFSATLTPIEYYINLLGGNITTDPYIQLASPFNKNNCLPLVNINTSIKYKDRDLTLNSVIDYIKAFISGTVGNYFIFCPSYEYLAKLEEALKIDEVMIHYQRRDMTDSEKNEFLELFVSEPKVTTLGILVLGSFFSEGIDLIEDRLIGAIIIGIGLSKTNFESDCIKECFNQQEKDGYLYAYLYPAMNKILQAIGRVIRSESDFGAYLFIDNRYSTYTYRNFINNKWSNNIIVRSPEEVKKKVDIFFNKKKVLL
ncbi:MAG: ATP-dependent DNA helicase [Bacilli bacterium]